MGAETSKINKEEVNNDILISTKGLQFPIINSSLEEVNKKEINEEKINKEEMNEKEINKKEKMNEEKINKEEMNEKEINKKEETNKENNLEEDLYEIIDKYKYNKLVYNHSINQNDLIFKNKELNKQKKNLQIEKINNKKLLNMIAMLENTIKLNDKHKQDLLINYDNLEYNKLVIEEKYLNNEEELDNYKNHYKILLNEKKNLNDELNNVIKTNNYNINKLDILNNKYNELFRKYNNLTLNNKNLFVLNEFLNTNNIKYKLEDIIYNILKKKGQTLSRNTLDEIVNNLINKLKNELMIMN
jgi:hypothetical protein